MKQKNSSFRVVESYDYNTLYTPVGNFTVSRGGFKCSGKLAHLPSALGNLVNYLKKQKNVAIALRNLCDEKVFASVVPEYFTLKSQPEIAYKIGDFVKFKDTKLNLAYKTGIIVKVNQKSVVVMFKKSNTKISAEKELITKI